MSSDGTARALLPVYHGWMLEPSGAGCHVITEECQNGIPRRDRVMVSTPDAAEGACSVWFESLKRVAEGGNVS